MKRLLIYAGIALIAAAGQTVRCAERPHSQQLDKANVLPLALDDRFEFRKTKLFLNDPKEFKVTTDPMILFERERMRYGAVTAVDRNARMGNYFTFFWRTQVKADVTVRLEYRQANLGSYVQAQEIKYTGAKGSMTTDFKVVGDDYLQDGRVIAWRALIIENGKIVALTASNLWD